LGVGLLARVVQGVGGGVDDVADAGAAVAGVVVGVSTGVGGAVD
jgi:hypothetical protein